MRIAIKIEDAIKKGGHNVGDGSWTLTVFVTDLQVERTLRVRGDLHIGGVMIRLVDELGRRLDPSKSSEFQFSDQRVCAISKADSLIF